MESGENLKKIQLNVKLVTHHNFLQILHLELMQRLQEVLLDVIVERVFHISHLF